MFFLCLCVFVLVCFSLFLFVFCVGVHFPPSADARLDQHLEFLLGNLDYQRENGRLAVLRALRFVVDKFPEPVLEERTELLFLPLVARLVSDDEESCRAASSEVAGFFQFPHPSFLLLCILLFLFFSFSPPSLLPLPFRCCSICSVALESRSFAW